MAKQVPLVLLIEDDTFLGNIYKTKFELEKFKVVVATDGVAGLDMAKKKKPDIILLDVLMPKMDGFTVLENLKKDKNLEISPGIGDVLSIQISLRQTLLNYFSNLDNPIKKSFKFDLIKSNKIQSFEELKRVVTLSSSVCPSSAARVALEDRLP